jgi:hypothetical protein
MGPLCDSITLDCPSIIDLVQNSSQIGKIDFHLEKDASKAFSSQIMMLAKFSEYLETTS